VGRGGIEPPTLGLRERQMPMISGVSADLTRSQFAPVTSQLPSRRPNSRPSCSFSRRRPRGAGVTRTACMLSCHGLTKTPGCRSLTTIRRPTGKIVFRNDRCPLVDLSSPNIELMFSHPLRDRVRARLHDEKSASATAAPPTTVTLGWFMACSGSEPPASSRSSHAAAPLSTSTSSPADRGDTRERSYSPGPSIPRRP
jgi:hypothetical protein